MNRPVIKGTANHKASIAKAKAQSVVSQSRTKGDAGLIAAADTLGKSYKPSEIDFELDKINIDVPEKKEKKPLTPEEQAAKDAKRQKRKDKRKEVGGKIVEGVETAVKGVVGVPVAVGYGLYRVGKYIVNELGDVVKDAKKHIKNKKEENDKEWEAEQQAKKDAKFVGEGEIDDPETNYKNTKQYKDIKKKEKEEAALAEQQASSKARFNQLMVEDEEQNDFSAIEAEPGVDYESSGAVDRGYKTWKHKQDAENIRSARETSGRMNTITEQRRQEAAKKHNVKVEDLVAKEIGGKKEFFPKQDVVGGKEETQWDDELGRFRKPEATIPVGKEEQEKAVEEMKPKYPKGMDPNLATTGEIALNYDTNTYEYTQQYFDRLAKEKIEQQKVEPTSTTTEPVVEGTEKKGTGVIINGREVSEARLRQLDKAYEKAGPNSKKNYIEDGYVPKDEREKGKSPMEMRDNRIYRNAVKGGVVQQNMIKSGYIPE